MRDLLPVARIWVARIEYRAVVLAQIVHHAQETAIGRKADLVAGREDPIERHLPVIVVDLLHGYWLGASLLNCRNEMRVLSFSSWGGIWAPREWTVGSGQRASW